MDILVQSRRSAKSAEKFFRRLLKGLRSVPRVMVTDKLRSYGAAHRVAMLSEDELKPIPANSPPTNSTPTYKTNEYRPLVTCYN